MRSPSKLSVKKMKNVRRPTSTIDLVRTLRINLLCNYVNGYNLHTFNPSAAIISISPSLHII